MKNNCLLILLSIIFVFSCQSSQHEKDQPPKPGFFHDVYFYLSPEVTKDQLRNFEAELVKLGKVETLIDYHIGVPAKTPRSVVDSTYQYSIITSFLDKKGHDIYQVHPLHDAFKVAIASIVDSVRIYDSFIKN